MSSDTAVVPSNHQMDSPDFIRDLLPAAEKTALLYNMSYLCLAKFSSLEKIIRANAVEAQMLFSSSEALLLLCVSTSDNMVKTLFPMLTAAVEKNKPLVAVKYLAKANQWIHDIIKEVENIVEDYKKLNIGVATATSDVISTKAETEDKKRKLTTEEKVLQNAVKEYNTKLREIQSDLIKVNIKIDIVDKELRELVNGIASRNKKFGIVAAVVPFLGLIINAIQKGVNDPGDRAAIDLAKNKMNQLQQDKTRLSKNEWEAQTEVMKSQMELTRATFDLGSVPDPVHLADVQTCLTRIQMILLQLRSFWEKIGVMVTNLQQKTFAGEDLIDVLSDFKEEFLYSLQVAKEAWKTFSGRCQTVMGMFSVQSKDAYKFLETSPSSLTQKEWQEMYDALTAKLNHFYPALEAKQAIEDQQAAESN
ncbi:uncharacterized protein LOC115166849 [Salmo trutta]|uniref:uncharacterized protein LOC115166849 n=1 Tax=Salmo trutta TaxID=8032 RepID=UPI0011309369|nr:uncharacterized protein LOC115166849 [Salmo trutta]XP_029576587.1 uncharacterized protein LOC115166849 [Salmo trutta]